MKKTALSITFIFVFTCLIGQNFQNNNSYVVFKQKPGNASAKADILSKIQEQYSSEIFSINPFLRNNLNTKNKVPKAYDLSNIFKIKLNEGVDAQKLISGLNKLNEIDYAEPYPVAKLLEVTNDPLSTHQYYIETTKILEAHKITKGDTNIVIGIVDSGFDLLHEDLKDNYKYNYNDPINNIDDDGDGYIDNFYGWDVADMDHSPQSLVNSNGENNYHGTKVAGMAAASTNNNIGIASIGYNTKILPIKAMDESGNIVAGYEGIVYAADHGCQIINCSWGGNTYSKFAQDVINYASLYKGCLIIAAAGNRGAAFDRLPTTLFYPAALDNVLSVAATNSIDELWVGSSYNFMVDVCAPGKDTYSTRQNNTYGAGSGTSYASPLVAGLAGLLKAYRPELNQKQLLEQIRISSDVVDTLSENNYYKGKMGYGRINAYKALQQSNLPSIRIDDFEISTNGNNGLLIGDTLKVSFTAMNYLAQVTNTTISLQSNSEYLSPISTSIRTGKLNTFEMVSSTLSPFLFEINSELPVNEKIVFSFEMKDQGYNDYQIFEAAINKNYINVQNGSIETTITSNGRIGYADSVKNLGKGIRYMGTNLIGDAGIVIANSSTEIVSTLLDKEDFYTTKTVDTSRTDTGILEAYSEYSTNNESTINIQIKNKTRFKTGSDISPTVLYKYNIINLGSNDLLGLKMAQFINWDIDIAANNTSVYYDDLNMLYTFSKSTNVTYAAICLLNKTTVTPYAFDLQRGGAEGIDITQGFNNDQKWFAMNNARSSAGTNTYGRDVASMLSSGFFDINVNDSVEFCFAHIFGTNLNDLIETASTLIEEYNVNNTISEPNSDLKIYPNPVNNYLLIEGINNRNAKIEICTINGKLIRTVNYNNSGNLYRLNTNNLKTGVYLIRLHTKNQILTAKFTKI